MRMHHYPSDVTDAQWALIEPQLPPGTSRRTTPQDRPAGRRRCHLLHPPHRLPVALSPQGLPAQEHRLAVLRRVATRRHPGHHPRPAPHEGPHGREALPPPHLRERRQPVGRHHLRRRAAGPRQRQERGRPQAPYRRGQHGLAAGRPGDGRRRRRRQGGGRAVRPAGGPADGQGRADVRRHQVPQLRPLRVGGGECRLGADHRAAARGVARAG